MKTSKRSIRLLLWIASSLSSLVLFYFMFPYAWQGIALDMPNDTFVHAMTPIDRLSISCPPYRWFIRKQFELIYPEQAKRQEEYSRQPHENHTY